MDWTGLKLLLEGIEPARQRKRYRLPESLQKSHPNTSSNSEDLLQYRDGSGAAEQTLDRS
jgi:hypothetical protein